MRVMKDSGVEWIGEIPVSWNIRKLFHLLCIIGSGTTPKRNEKYYDGNIPWLNTGDLNDSYITKASKHISHVALEKYSVLKMYKSGSIIIAMYGATIGKIGIATFDFTTNQACCVMNCSNELNNHFLFYVLTACNSYLLFSARGSGQPNINQDIVKSIRVPLPQYKEQQRIAAYLDTRCAKIDTMISQEQAVIEKLKEYKQALITRAVTKGLNPDVPMKDSGVDWIGEIPAAWDVVRLKYLSKIERGGSPRPIEEYLTDDANGYNWIKIGDALKGNKYINETKQKIRKEGLRKSCLVHKGDLILSNSMSFGQPYIMNIDGCIHDGWLMFACISRIDKMFLYYFLISSFCMIQFTLAVTGGVVQNLNIEKVKNTVIFIPPVIEQLAIIKYLDDRCAIIDATVSKKQMLIDKLTEYKKSLIYEVVTGKKEV